MVKGSLPHGELQEETEDCFKQQSLWSCLKTPIKCNMSRIKDLHSKFTISAQQFSNTFHIEEPQIIPTIKNKPEMGGVAVDSKGK